MDKNDLRVSYPEQLCQLQQKSNSGKGRSIEKGLQDAERS
jgi:hypothetical protein